MRNLHPENMRAMGLALNLENWEDMMQMMWMTRMNALINRRKYVGHLHCKVCSLRMHITRLRSKQHKNHLSKEINANIGDSLCQSCKSNYER